MKCYLKDYPRPQFVRNSWENLNGKWNFLFDDENKGEIEKYYLEFPKKYIINVPFTYETEQSGINEQDIHYIVWYNRKIYLSKNDIENKNTILHFEGSDYITKVWINGNYIGKNIGGYSRFSFDIGEYLIDGENDITVKIEDSLSKDQPRGKQRYKKESFKCWYVQTTGIWKTVWLEFVSKECIENIKITPIIDEKKIRLDIVTNIDEKEFENKDYYIETEISFNGEILNISKSKIEKNNETIKINICSENIIHKLQKWEIGNPNLYDIIYKLYCNHEIIDVVNSYFGLRDISVKGNKIYLNEKELYLKLILDQGYWKTTHLTPLNEEVLIKDIDAILKLGYNGVRKHQKIEDERFLYWCDVKGLLVWSEMANCYNFSDISLQNFTNEWIRVVKQNYNHPSIMAWVPINESWGVPNIKNEINEQNFANSIYYITKSLDNTRPVISNDGWEHTISDIITIHDYEQDYKILLEKYIDRKEEILNSLLAFNSKHCLFSNGYKYSGQPIIMSEYGGIAINSKNGWGYGKMVRDSEELIERFSNLTKAIKSIPYITGYCYTQLTDVQQEINGLLDENRNFKIEYNKIKEINDM